MPAKKNTADKKISKTVKKDIPQLYSPLLKTYFSDLTSANMIYTKIVRSPITKGRIKSLTLEDIPEGYFLFTAADFGEENYVETLDIQTEILASSEIYYKGQPIALLAGPVFTDLLDLEKNIKMEFEKDPASKIKEKEYPYAQRFIRNGKAQKPEEFTKLFSKKNYDIKGTWTSVLNAPSCNEANGAFCTFDKNILTISTPTQWPKHLQENIKRIFNLKTEEVFIRKTISSGPHTNTIWQNTVIAVMASLVAIKTGKTAQLVLSREEHFEYLIKKSPISIKIRSAVKKDGIIEAVQVLIELDSGYHNPFAAEILDRLVIAANNIYSVRNIEIIAKAYESYTPPVSFNIECIDSQAFFAIENQMQKICNVTGFLPDELRMKNFERKFSLPFTFTNEKVREAFSAIEKMYDVNRKFISYRMESKNRKIDIKNLHNFPLRGIGVACGFNGIGYFGSNIFACNQKMEATLESDGTLEIHALQPSASTLEVWKNTAAQILEIDPKQIKLNSIFDINEDLSVPENVYANVSVMTYLLKKCCQDIQSKRFRKPLPITSTKGFTSAQKKVWNKEKFSGSPFFLSSFGAVVLELEINPYTYKIYIKNVKAVLNAGKIGIPKIAENSVKLSIQHALTELVVDENLHCDQISVSFVQSDNDPTQIDGLISRILPAAFTSALSQATGHEINTIPVKPQHFFKEMISNENSVYSK
ncbi:MAG: xanthine dehydrogenase family protein [Treponema sp.]|uniref:xanthine dehydrogenase family protein n=1 Tax=Treponema sp. TaxID=166 RepID=UPI001DAD7E19|nr:xanthine dehydrogenase family protein [Treponema sp.]MBS7310306.1 xanthine dehydrogenase family protein [Treponema sp.]MCI5697258.1 xanthine dehydrogenase family protein molybdopterin-binding subunit [Spirochaetia bacterium]